MGYWVRAMKRQLLVASLFVMLLAPSVTLLTFITYYGKHFTVINDVSLEKNPYRIFHSVAFFTGMCLSSILIIAGLLCIVATVRELEGAMAMGFFCFAVVFCASVQAVHWTITSSTKVEEAMMDVYDFVYEDVRSNSSSNSRSLELLTIHKTFLCCGKKSPFGEASSIENETCQSETMGKEDCLQEIRDFLKTHMSFVFILMTITIIIMVYGMFLTSFLWVSIRFNNSLDRKGKYILANQ